MRVYFRLISFFFLFFCAGEACAQNKFSLGEFLQRDGRMQTSVAIRFKKADITGLCIMKMVNDTIKGSLINEFGIRAFDFRYTVANKKVKLFDIIKPLDKWYIKKVLRSDFTFLFNALTSGKIISEGKRTLTETEAGELRMINERFKITYLFTPINNDRDETAE